MIGQNLLLLLFSQVVQVTILAVAAWWATRCFARNRPHLAHAIWLLVLLKCVTPPICHNPVSPFCWHWSEQVQKPFAVSESPPPIAKFVDKQGDQRRLDPVVIQANRQGKGNYFPSAPFFQNHKADQQAQFTASAKPTASFQSGFWLIGLWLAGVSLIAVIALLRSVLFLHWLRTLPGRKHDALSTQLERLARQLGVKRKVRLEIVDGPVGPAVFGFWKARIVLPQAIVADQTPSQLEPLLAHELIHLRRGDLCWSALQILAT